MAAQISLDCPHCLTQKSGFCGYSPVPSPLGQEVVFLMLLQCQVCGEGVVGKFRDGMHIMNDWVNGRSGQSSIQLLGSWPNTITPRIPEHMPANIESFYSQGMDSLSRKNFDAAGTMFRKSLDTALKRLDPSGKGNLQQRIDKLPVAVGVTPAMKEWAHEIRELGNDAAHEEEPFTEIEATTLQAFTELFLTYTFTLPGMLGARKATVTTIRNDII